jgi:plasmid stabilization system protein ParE
VTHRILFRPEAEAELREAVDWYESRGKGLGAEFLRALDAAIAGIDRYPLASPLVFGDCRRAVLRKFPYTVIYTAREDKILILACMHGRRDPHNWRTRV